MKTVDVKITRDRIKVSSRYDDSGPFMLELAIDEATGTGVGGSQVDDKALTAIVNFDGQPHVADLPNEASLAMVLFDMDGECHPTEFTLKFRPVGDN